MNRSQHLSPAFDSAFSTSLDPNHVHDPKDDKVDPSNTLYVNDLNEFFTHNLFLNQTSHFTV